MLASASIYDDYVKSIQESVDFVKNYNWTNHPNVGQVCYGELGCFGKCMSTIPIPPQTPLEIDTKFYITTKQDRYRREKEVRYSERSMNLNSVPSGASVAMVAHGWTENSHDPVMVKLRNALQAHYDVVIMVDWTKGASVLSLYLRSVPNTEVVGRQMALLANRLIKQRGVPEDKIHIYGFSLGGQVHIF